MTDSCAEYRSLLAEIAQAWRSAKHAVVFTGAGMSTESGLPDFRSAQGLWKMRPESLATLDAMRRQTDEFYFFYQWRIAKLWEVRPNPGHLALAELELKRHLKAVITQNVDGLHQRAGSDNVLELHGSLRTVSCTSCYTAIDSRALLPERDLWEAEYAAGKYHHGQECHCRNCQGLLRPDVVLFGESLPRQALNNAFEHSEATDFFVVVGSSLAVSPANICPEMAVSSGAKLLIINREPTPLDAQADWVIRRDAAGVLEALTKKIL